MAVDNNHAPNGNLEPRSELSDFEALKASGALDEILAKIDAGQVQITGEGGFLQEMVKAVLERGLQTELSAHLGYNKATLLDDHFLTHATDPA